MNMIRILSENAALGKRLYEILYPAGFADLSVSDLSAMPLAKPGEIRILYAKNHITDLFRQAETSGAQVILLLNPDCYARYLDTARHAGVRLLLMPVTPDALLDAVREAEEAICDRQRG
ncbi:MAG: hypothetical protein IKS42_02005 [Oscillospiraceae bacterium]|nr:hypothetical protein [Oscillospiraceae bacterium]